MRSSRQVWMYGAGASLAALAFAVVAACGSNLPPLSGGEAAGDDGGNVSATSDGGGNENVVPLDSGPGDEGDEDAGLAHADDVFAVWPDGSVPPGNDPGGCRCVWSLATSDSDSSVYLSCGKIACLTNVVAAHFYDCDRSDGGFTATGTTCEAAEVVVVMEAHAAASSRDAASDH